MISGFVLICFVIATVFFAGAAVRDCVHNAADRVAAWLGGVALACVILALGLMLSIGMFKAAQLLDPPASAPTATEAR